MEMMKKALYLISVIKYKNGDSNILTTTIKSVAQVNDIQKQGLTMSLLLQL
jgi:hypothetical protein